MYRWILACLLAVAAAQIATPARAAMTEAQVKASVAAAFGVQVLRVKRTKVDGQDAYLVTMMNPAGDFNEAFQVNTIAVDAGNGRPIPRFRHGSSGAMANESPIYGADRQAPNALQSGTVWR